MNEKKNHYIITFRDHKENKVISLKCEEIKDSPLGLSFIAVSNFVFQSSLLVVNPAEEHLKQRYSNTKTLHLSIYNVLSIEEVGPEQNLVFGKDRSNLLIMTHDFT